MDVGSVSGITSLATAMSQERIAQDVSIALVKKAIDLQAAGALALIEALPAVTNLPANLGNSVDTTA